MKALTYIEHGSVLRSISGITVGHEMVGMGGCDCAEVLALIEEGKTDTTPLITHR